MRLFRLALEAGRWRGLWAERTGVGGVPGNVAHVVGRPLWARVPMFLQRRNLVSGPPGSLGPQDVRTA